ncbi:MAG: ASPIC/UnbV domain-containing protein, partial [Phycisphaerales bacterium]|nr:ASPIC/UnbV domain-containing protein [Phycisphaerales bacterium]
SNTLQLALQGSGQNTKGLGAKVTVRMNNGSTKTKWNHDGSGFQSSMSVPLLFTFPNNASPESIDIEWADGQTQSEEVVGLQMHITQK